MSVKVFFEGAVVSAVCAVKAFQSKTKRIEQGLSMNKNVRSGWIPMMCGCLHEGLHTSRWIYLQQFFCVENFTC